MSRPYRGESRDEWEHVTCPEDVMHAVYYEPDAPIYCRACGDVQVEARGDECAVCSSPEFKAEAAEFAAWCAANPIQRQEAA